MKLKPEQTQDALQIIKGLSLFSGCPDSALSLVAGLLEVNDYSKGKVILMDQEIGRTLYILAKGKVSVWKRVGGDKIQLATLAAPDVFGERSMFDETPASALVKAEDLCRTYILDRAAFKQAAEKCPALVDIVKLNMAALRAKRITPGPKPDAPETGA